MGHSNRVVKSEWPSMKIACLFFVVWRGLPKEVFKELCFLWRSWC